MRTRWADRKRANKAIRAWRSIGRICVVGAQIAIASALLSGCSLLLGLDDGEAEADRLQAVVENLPGVDDVDTFGSEQSITYAATARNVVHMAPTATADEFAAVLLAWHSAANDPDVNDGISRTLEVEYRGDRCEAVVNYETAPEQLRGTAEFLPAACDAHAAASIRTDDTWYVREAFINGTASDPVDIAQLRGLPGAVTPFDIWKVDGTEHRFGSYQDPDA
ncbi:hypothetical protein [Microbacterium sp. Yaish 1]|uniref:hypothetical protein n=1 Tax=Microbacterium sp. Yaish 1 TaxID=2025014 RepID=UPI000B94181A|nr:hypothetical protein [Microbacterium sp. Yaish 1]OYC97974.1 hypothetical protein CI089_05490 [Microbacterium sp. Yaish 1]